MHQQRTVAETDAARQLAVRHPPVVSPVREILAGSPGSSPEAPLTDGGVTLGTPPRVVPLPAAWRQAAQRAQLWHGVSDVHPTGAPTPNGTGVLLQKDDGGLAHIVLVGSDHRTIATLGDVPDPSGQGQITYNAIGPDYGEFVFAPVNGEAASWRWQLYLWNRRTGRLRMIARNPVNASGQPLHGGFVQPQLTTSAITWIQAAPDTTHGWGGSELRDYTLATGKIRTLYTGLVTNFIRYNNEIVYAEIKPDAPAPTASSANGPPMRMAALNSLTGTSVAPPAGLSFENDAPNAIETDGDLIVWATSVAMRAWRPGWGRTITLVPEQSQWPAGAAIGASSTTYPRLYGHFLAWNTGPTLLLDLRTNSVVKLTSTPGGDDMSGPWLALEYYTASNGSRTTEFNQTLLNLAELPDLPAR